MTMTKEKELSYKKAYVELYELIKRLTIQEQEKIPNSFIEYICNNKDEEYFFEIDNEKGILEQDYMVETKALIVKMYEKYLAPREEDEFWRKYDSICLNMIESAKENKYNSDDLFKNKVIETEKRKSIEATNSNNLLVKVKEKSIIKKIIDIIKKIFK